MRSDENSGLMVYLVCALDHIATMTLTLDCQGAISYNLFGDQTHIGLWLIAYYALKESGIINYN